MQIAILLMIAHALLSTNFNPIRLTCQGGCVVEFWPHKQEVGGSNPSRGGGIFVIFKNYLCKLPIANKFQLEKKTLFVVLIKAKASHTHTPVSFTVPVELRCIVRPSMKDTGLRNLK